MVYRVLLDGGEGEKLQRRRPLRRVALHAADEEPRKLRRVLQRKLGCIGAHDPHDERRVRSCVAKGVPKSTELGQSDAERPDIRLLVVGVAYRGYLVQVFSRQATSTLAWLAIAQLRREIAGRANDGLRHLERR